MMDSKVIFLKSLLEGKKKKKSPVHLFCNRLFEKKQRKLQRIAKKKNGNIFTNK